jgi:hypothetical protein
MEFGFLRGCGTGIGRGSGRWWRREGEYKKVDQKEEANKKRPRKKNPLLSDLNGPHLLLIRFFQIKIRLSKHSTLHPTFSPF